MNTTLLRQSITSSARADFARSGGPGGQNVNKLNTKVILRIQVSELAGLNDDELTRMQQTLANRISGEGELIITASEERSQRINLERAYTRMETLIVNAARIPRPRRPTRPSRAVREERLNSKRLRSRIKAERGLKPQPD